MTIDVNNRSENAFWEYFLFGTTQPNPPLFVWTSNAHFAPGWKQPPDLFFLFWPSLWECVHFFCTFFTLFCTVLHYFALFFTVLHSFALFCTVLHIFLSHYFALFWPSLWERVCTAENFPMFAAFTQTSISKPRSCLIDLKFLIICGRCGKSFYTIYWIEVQLRCIVSEDFKRDFVL